MNVTTVINGHMPAQTTPADLQQYANFVRTFVDAARAAKKSGQTVDQFAATWKVPAAFPGYSTGLGNSLKDNAQLIWDELR